ncbi:hypothetical protein LBMAG42_56290 [Deltaproteobacteria bacterium]|nr:hypothetical protein LBMAG42_56290 [Deltaproteobacteria bacterium]
MTGDHALRNPCPSPHLFVVIEGVDGVGKSSVVRALSARLGATAYKSPGGPFALARPLVDEGLDGLTRYYFFRAAVQYDSACISKLLEQAPVVCDRYIESTRVCHAIRDPRVWALDAGAALLKPTRTFVLTAHPDVIARRLLSRPERGHDEQDLAFILRCDALFRTLGHPVLDTSTTTADTIADRIVADLERGDSPKRPDTHVTSPEST